MFTAPTSGLPARRAVLAVLAVTVGLFGTGGARASALSQAAASLSPGQSVKLHTNAFWTSVYDPSTENGVILQYANSGVWDPVRNEARFIGKAGTNSVAFKFLVYDEATNTWSRNRALHSDLSSNQSGHGYDHNAVDPSTGDQYFQRFENASIYKWTSSTQSWTKPTSIPGGSDCCESLTYFPPLGLVSADNYGCRYYDGSSWTSCTGPSRVSFGYHSISEYQPDANVTVFGGGNSGPRVLYRLSSSGSYVRLGNAPGDLGSAPDQGILVAAPNSSSFIAFFRSSRTWYAFDPVADTWTSLATSTGACTTPCDGTPQLVTEPKGGWDIAIPIPEHGVMMFVTGDADGENNDVWLYKYSGGPATAPPPIPGNLRPN